ncbi:MAG TPA: CrcB family protein [Planctomycetota bacterium]|nr:CrcB family protein [Planctomycetota bacterium]
MNFLWQLFLVSIGGALGSGLRFGVYSAYSRWTNITQFPAGTLTVNLVGCFLITFITTIGLSTNLISANTRLFLNTGIMGGLTTYSAFNNDLISALDKADYRGVAWNVLATFAGCLLAGLLGLWAGRAYVGEKIGA